MECGDEVASAWLEANDAWIRSMVKSSARGSDDAAQEARVAVWKAFNSDTFDPTQDHGPYMRTVVFRTIQRHFHPRGADVMDDWKRYMSTDAMVSVSQGNGDYSGHDDADLLGAYEEVGFDSVETERLAGILREEIQNGLSLKEAALKHGLSRFLEKTEPGVTWDPNEHRWLVDIKAKGKRHHGGRFRSRVEANERAREIRASLGVVPKGQRKCGLEDCDSKHYSSGFCHRHYKQDYRARRKAA